MSASTAPDARTVASGSRNVAAGVFVAVPATFEAHVAQRLAMGAALYGETGYDRPLARLLGEMIEECADIGGWGEIAGAALQGRTDLAPGDRAAVARAMSGAREDARRAWRRLRDALQIIENKEEM